MAAATATPAPATSPLPPALLQDLQAHQLIKRQQAVRRLKKCAEAASGGAEASFVSAIERKLSGILRDTDSTWQAKHGAFLAAAGFLELKKLGESCRKEILKFALSNLEHKEYRVRLVVASTLEALATVDGVAIYLAAKKDIFDSINRNFHRDGKQAKIQNKSKFLLPKANLMDLASEDSMGGLTLGGSMGGGPAIGKVPDLQASKPASQEAKADSGETLATIDSSTPPKPKGVGGGLRKGGLRRHTQKKPAGVGVGPPGAKKAQAPTVTNRISAPAALTRWKAELREQMHDTEGWKSLETSFGALKAIISGTGEKFSQYVDGEVLGLLERASTHTNRFVREIAYHTAAAIGSTCDLETLKKLAKRTCTLIAKGLADNWSQVRYASSIAARHLLLRAQKAGFAGDYVPILLPPMCINRYYVAQGVRIYSQESWRLIMGKRGAELVAKHIDKVVEFYVSQAQADNHAVREAACACITELAIKVERKAVIPHVPKLLETLIDCFRDDSWPVRDAACSACGDFIRAFPAESKSKMTKLYSLWFVHLKDSIPTVREGAAIALGKAVEAYKEEGKLVVAKKLKEVLPAVQDQAKDSKRLANMENVTQFGVARRVTGAEALKNSDQQMYSCGSLAPKMKKRGAGCMDHSFQRLAEPWEVTDGAIYLLRELASHDPETVGTLIEQTAEMVSKRHYGHHVYLKQTMWKALPIIAKRMGKRPFKRVMSPMLEPLVETLSCQHRLAMHAAADCLEELAKFLGPLVFTGRLEEADLCDRVKKSGMVSFLKA